MSILDNIQVPKELPGWLNNLVALARPVAVTMTVAIPAVGSFMVGAVAFWSPTKAMAMATTSIKFLEGIPDAGWTAIAAIALGYTAAKSAEVVKAPPVPTGRPSPEQEGGTTVDTSTLEFATPAFLKRTDIPPVRFGPDSAGTDIIE